MPECPTVSTPGRRLAGWLARPYLLFLQDSEELRVLSTAQIVDDLQRHLGPNLSIDGVAEHTQSSPDRRP